MKEAGSGTTPARSFFILTLVFSLIFVAVLNANSSTVGTDAFAKKGSKKISDINNNDDDGNGRLAAIKAAV